MSASSFEKSRNDDYTQEAQGCVSDDDIGGAAVGVIVSDDAVTTFAKAQAVIDFTAPAATVAFSELAAQARAVHVIGTTGLTDDDIAHLDAAAHNSIGQNVARIVEGIFE